MGPDDINIFHAHINNVIDRCETGVSLDKKQYGDLCEQDRRSVQSSFRSIARHVSNNHTGEPEGFKVYLHGFIPKKTFLSTIVDKADLLRPYDGS